MSRRPRFQAIRGAMTWKDAIEWWDKGRPDMVALLISEEPIPEQLRDAVAKRIIQPPVQARPLKRKFTDEEAEGLRGLIDGETLAGKRLKAALLDWAERLSVSVETMRDIYEKKKSYRDPGEEIKKSPRRKRSPHQK